MTDKIPYRIDFVTLQLLAETNYLRLIRLYPDMHSRVPGEKRVITCSSGDDHSRNLTLSILENSPYTTRLEILMSSPVSWIPDLKICIHAYHDARMVDVVTDNTGRQLSGTYPYPNPRMYQKDEKIQLSLFLGECLHSCTVQGYETVFL